ncbi:MAG: UDP-N-acetylglucosamine 1-carboxyvinyltransferase [Eubacterium sp.]|nr:UDP-N-acetylglucosamine 1-carboxyvinyltransferase [Eubacterium sp.]
MWKYMIRGGTPLTGEVVIGGAKNAALGIIVAAIMANEPVTIENIPDVDDVRVLLDALEDIGAIVERLDHTTVRINGALINDVSVDRDSIRKIRGSYYLVGALLGKYKKALVALPGGCQIGSRPIDQHIKGFEQLGAKVSIHHGKIDAKAEHLRGNHIYLDCPSVGATINIMMAACMAEGKTIIENPAKEPHIVDVANFLNSMGANIRGAGTDAIRIRGVSSLHGSEYSIIPDQIEAGTFMLMVGATKGDVLIKNVIPKHLEAITAKLTEIGCKVLEYDDCVRVIADSRFSYANVKTMPYPGFPTDMQPQMTTLLSLSKGTSIVTETIFETRLKYVGELRRMGANIAVEGNAAFITGVENFTGAEVVAPDLRAGAALVMAALAAEGVSSVEQIHYIERGYERFEDKIRGLGGHIEKVDDEDERGIRKFMMKVGA